MAKQKVKLPRKTPAALGEADGPGEATSAATRQRPAKTKAKGGRKPKRIQAAGGEADATILQVTEPRATAPKAKSAAKRKATLAAGNGPVGAPGPAKRTVKGKSKPARKRRLAGAAPVPGPELGEIGRLERLERAIRDVRGGTLASPRTRKLLSSGVAKMGQKVIEEAAEVAIEAIRGNRAALVDESVDLFYNLLALWSGSGVALGDVWAEMDRREAALGMAEKLPKAPDEET